MNTNKPGAGPESSLRSEPPGRASVSAEIPPSGAALVAGVASATPLDAPSPPPSALEASVIVAPAAVPHPPRVRLHRPSLHLHLPPPPHIPVRLHTFDSFRYRDYRFLWAATFLSSSGFWLQQVVIGWLTYEMAQAFGAPMATLLSGGVVLIALAGIAVWVRSLWRLDS